MNLKRRQITGSRKSIQIPCTSQKKNTLTDSWNGLNYADKYNPI